MRAPPATPARAAAGRGSQAPREARSCRSSCPGSCRRRGSPSATNAVTASAMAPRRATNPSLPSAASSASVTSAADVAVRPNESTVDPAGSLVSGSAASSTWIDGSTPSSSDSMRSRGPSSRSSPSCSATIGSSPLSPSVPGARLRPQPAPAIKTRMATNGRRALPSMLPPRSRKEQLTCHRQVREFPRSRGRRGRGATRASRIQKSAALNVLRVPPFGAGPDRPDGFELWRRATGVGLRAGLDSSDPPSYWSEQTAPRAQITGRSESDPFRIRDD